MKNRIINYSVIALLLLFTASCDKGFDELNTNEVDPTAIDPAFIFPIHPDPIVRIGAADEFDVRALVQGVEIEIFGAGTIAAA